jgi:hypothetical protein
MKVWIRVVVFVKRVIKNTKIAQNLPKELLAAGNLISTPKVKIGEEKYILKYIMLSSSRFDEAKTNKTQKNER